MLDDSVDFMLKKARFQHFTIYVNTVKLIQHFCLSVPTTFDEHCSYFAAFVTYKLVQGVAAVNLSESESLKRANLFVSGLPALFIIIMFKL